MQHKGDERLAGFLGQRKRLLRLAYRHLGSVSEAEDVVQDAWLRFSAAPTVDDPARLLPVIVTRLCLDRLKSARARRLDYIGEWLPEPATGEAFEAPDDRALDISFAVMRTLENLSAAERAAFILHDIWDLPFEEIAPTLSRSPAACRKLASRARMALTEARKRFAPSAEDVARFLETFRMAMESNSPEPIKALLAEDAELISDGGGKALAARNVVAGREAVSRFLFGIGAKYRPGGVVEIAVAIINDAPGLVMRVDGKAEQTFGFDLDATGALRTVYIMRNPDKLVTLGGGGVAGRPAGWY